MNNSQVLTFSKCCWKR